MVKTYGSLALGCYEDLVSNPSLPFQETYAGHSECEDARTAASLPLALAINQKDEAFPVASYGVQLGWDSSVQNYAQLFCNAKPPIEIPDLKIQCYDQE